MTRIHILSGEFPPATGGIARFSETVARGLGLRGLDVHVWTPSSGRDAHPGPVTVHALPDCFGPASCQALDAAVGSRDIVLLQYAPNLLGARGANVSFCRWLMALSRRGRDVRVMFHEPFFYFGWQSAPRNALALVHRLMAVLLLRAARVAYVSTPAWAALLRPYARRGLQFSWVPVPSAIPVAPDREAVSRVRQACGGSLLVGHFSAYPSDVRTPLATAIVDVLARHHDSRVLCIGRGSDEFVKTIDGGGRVQATGEIDADGVSAAIQACDLFVQPYPDGATTRRSSLSTLLAHGACVVTTTGVFTEPLWTSEPDVIAMASVGNRRGLVAEVARLAASRSLRERQGDRAREFYGRHLDESCAVEALLHKGSRPRPVIAGAHFFAADCSEASRQASFARQLRGAIGVRLLNVQFADPALQQHVPGIETVAVLRSDSASESGRRGPRKPIVSEIFDALAARAEAERVRYFLYVNADVEVTPDVIELIAAHARDAYVFARTDVSDTGEENVLRSGIDGVAFDARWWRANRARFRPYILGEPVWDNVYAAIALSRSDGIIVARPGLLRHEQHPTDRRDSPFAEHQRLLAALDAPYFTLWCEYYERIRRVSQALLPAAAARAASEVFHRRAGPRSRIVQSARAAKAHLRHALAETRGAS